MTRRADHLTNSIRWDPTASRRPTMTFNLSPKIKAAALRPPATNKPAHSVMAKWIGPQTSGPRGGFTLVELLLALVLMLMLAGAVVFSFSTLLRGRQLDEG